MGDEVSKYIHSKLFADSQEVLFTDVMNEFQVSSSRAKKEMYEFYKITKSKVGCIIVCCFKSGVVEVVRDVLNFESNHDVLDLFIYAFSPMANFSPVNKPSTRPLGIENCYKLEFKVPPPKEVEEPQRTVRRAKTHEISTPKTLGVQRAKTHPEPSKKPEKSMGLQSTKLRERMRDQRGAKEKERLEALRKRKQAQEESLKKDPKREKQLRELSKMFEDDGDSDGETARPETRSETVKSDSSSDFTVEASVQLERIPERTPGPADQEELGKLLETTAEESLVEVPWPDKSAPKSPEKASEEPTSFVDEDGYIVTNRQTQRATSTPAKRRHHVEMSAPREQQPQQPPKKKVQQSVMSFFGKKK
ncbi:LAMI_0C08812g1_1 [Lachancea mirantina]|uniref:LAMI_0C08812g1_1 n=1 Tax=Lachancea mirantina TaxID=1230905 RepID=A0A1G4J4U7_9SACH|nr:LAMI_0C08812g1_1 [Lachancea mirantina]